MSSVLLHCSDLNFLDIVSIITGIAAVFVSVTAGFIGLLALGVSIWQGFETRKNYRLSVTPNVFIDGEWTTTSDVLGISLINKGVGPAIINSIIIDYLGRQFNFLSNTSDFLSFLSENNKELPNFIVHVLSTGEYLAQGENFPMLYLVRPYNEKSEIFENAFTGMTITVTYKSIYGNIFKTTYSKEVAISI